MRELFFLNRFINFTGDAIKNIVPNRKVGEKRIVLKNNAGFAVMEEVFVPALEKALYNSNAAEGSGQIDDFDKEEWN